MPTFNAEHFYFNILKWSDSRIGGTCRMNWMEDIDWNFGKFYWYTFINWLTGDQSIQMKSERFHAENGFAHSMNVVGEIYIYHTPHTLPKALWCMQPHVRSHIKYVLRLNHRLCMKINGIILHVEWQFNWTASFSWAYFWSVPYYWQCTMQCVCIFINVRVWGAYDGSWLQHYCSHTVVVNCVCVELNCYRLA